MLFPSLYTVLPVLELPVTVWIVWWWSEGVEAVDVVELRVNAVVKVRQLELLVAAGAIDGIEEVLGIYVVASNNWFYIGWDVWLGERFLLTLLKCVFHKRAPHWGRDES